MSSSYPPPPPPYGGGGDNPPYGGGGSNPPYGGSGGNPPYGGGGQPPYGNYPGGGYPGGPAGGPPPPNYLVWAILTTIFCCLPFGVASIVFSTQVNSKWAMGDFAGAINSSNNARRFALISFGIGLVIVVLAFVVGVVGAMSGNGTSGNGY